MYMNMHRPAGVFEMEKFAEGSKGILAAMVEVTKNGACTIIGRYHHV